jgi:prefoldin beta subunit
LSDDSNIYKLVGPVLLKQEKTEAVLAVDGRLEYIENEMYGIQVSEDKELLIDE